MAQEVESQLMLASLFRCAHVFVIFGLTHGGPILFQGRVLFLGDNYGTAGDTFDEAPEKDSPKDLVCHKPGTCFVIC